MIAETVVYTDGASSGNPGPSGWAIWINGEQLLGGYFLHATNNFAELFAIFQVYVYAPAGGRVHIISDSKTAVFWAMGQWGTTKTHIKRLLWAMKFVRRDKHLIVSFTIEKGKRSKGNKIVDREAKRQARLARLSLPK